MKAKHRSEKLDTGQRTARVGWNNRVQTVSIPVDFRFPDSVREVFIHRDGERVVLTPRPGDWSGFLDSKLKASADFMIEREVMKL